MVAGANQASIGFDLAITTVIKASSGSTAAGGSWMGGKSSSAGSSKIINLLGNEGREYAMASRSAYTTKSNTGQDEDLGSWR